MKEQSTMIIAEAGVNHNGDVKIARALVDAAAESMADVIKFQTWKTDNIITPHAEKPLYQKMAMGEAETQYEMLKRLELDYSAFLELKEYANKKGIAFISTPDDEESADFLDNIGIPFFKIGSGEITNLSLLEHIAYKRRPIILSTGMSDFAEVERAVKAIKDIQVEFKVAELQVGKFIIPPLTLLHCVSSYPSPVEESNIRVIQTMSLAFGLPVGYSDHSEEPSIALAAVALGATVIERHFTLNRSMPGPDHSSSLEPLEFKKMAVAIRNIEKALGDGIKRPMPSEKENRKIIRKNLVASCEISNNSIITSAMLSAKRTGDGISAELRDVIIGKKAIIPIMKGENIKWGMFC